MADKRSFSPSSPSSAALLELSEAMIHCREQAEVSNWTDFCALMNREANIKMTRTQFETVKTKVRVASAVITAIHLWGKVRPFYFRNGIQMDANTLAEVSMALRDRNGNLIKGPLSDCLIRKNGPNPSQDS